MKVSDEAQDLFMKLVAWECFGSDEYDPKTILREISLSDLKQVSLNIQTQSDSLYGFACIPMIELEFLFKSGHLKGDWQYTKVRDQVELKYEPMFLPLEFHTLETKDVPSGPST